MAAPKYTLAALEAALADFGEARDELVEIRNAVQSSIDNINDSICRAKVALAVAEIEQERDA